MKTKIIIILFPFLALISCNSLQELTETDSPIYLSPNSMVIKLDSAQGAVYRDFQIVVPEKQLYSFTIKGYGEGFPTYTIITNVSSGGAFGTQNVQMKISDKILGKGKYEGYMPVYLKIAGKERLLKLDLTIIVS